MSYLTVKVIFMLNFIYFVFFLVEKDGEDGGRWVIRKLAKRGIWDYYKNGGLAKKGESVQSKRISWVQSQYSFSLTIR